MSSEEIKQYYDATQQRAVRSDLIYAVEIVDEPKLAIDCGCGAGADIQYLLEHGFTVYGFDIEDESIKRCMQRFKDNKNVVLSKADFATYIYQKSSLVVADASLFFCSAKVFDLVWEKIFDCLFPKGIFCGSFLGPDDSMAKPNPGNSLFWPEVLIFDEQKLRNLFKGYEICRFTEHKHSGTSPQGTAHDWHVYSVVARKY